MASKKPGFDNALLTRNRRSNRYDNSGADNRADRRHKQVAGTTIGFDTVPAPDEITDSGNGLAGFQVDEHVQTQGSTSNDGEDVVQTVAAGALGVDAAVTLESAGAAVTLRSQNNLHPSRFL